MIDTMKVFGFVKKRLIYIMLGLTMCTSFYGCMMSLVMNENIESLQEADEEMMSSVQNMKSVLELPNEYVQLSDTVAYYKSEKKYVKLNNGGRSFRLHRFYFKRAIYTDSLSSGFSVIIADFGRSGILVENQQNVTLPAHLLGEEVSSWKSSMNNVTKGKKMYYNLSSNGMQIRTFIRASKI